MSALPTSAPDPCESGPGDVLVHVGLHKTGTTWLQELLFDRREAGLVSPWTRREILRCFVLVNPLAFDAAGSRARLEDEVHAAHASGLVPVLSHERLSGNPHSGGYDRKEIADRIASVLPRARVLMVIREQRDMIASVYKQYVREGGPASPRRYLDPPRQGLARIPLFSFDFFEYHHLVAYYQQCFGPERVQVLPFELLCRDEPTFVAQVLRFAGGGKAPGATRERRNVGLSACCAALKRRLNRTLVRDRLNPDGWCDDPRLNTGLDRLFQALDRRLPRWLEARAEARLQRVVRHAVDDRYRASNRRTACLTGLDLGSFGYDV